MVLVAGARAGAVHDVLSALLPGRRRLPYPPRSTYVVLRGSAPTSASFHCLTDAGTGPPRPLRRVELSLPDSLLDRVTLVGVRAVPADRGPHAHLVADLVRQCESVILVSDGRGPFQPAEIDLLRQASELGKGVFLAVTHANEHGTWADVVLRNQNTLARQLPELALRAWHPVTRSGTSMLELRDSVLAWSRDRRRPAPRRAPAIRVAPGAADTGWRDVLRVEVERAHGAALACAERELGQLRTLAGNGRLRVEQLDRRLASLSRTVAAQVRRAVETALDGVLRTVLLSPPDAGALERVAVVLQRDVAERCCANTTCVRALRVTGTAAAVVATAREALDIGDLTSAGGVLPPLWIGLTSNCLPMLRSPASTGVDQVSRESVWVCRALESLSRELERELSRQFTYLGQATSDLIVDGLDHDLLLV